MSRRPLVCLVDPYGDGHHPMYASVYAETFFALGCEVWLVVPPTLVAAMPSQAKSPWQVVSWDPVATMGDPTTTSEKQAEQLWQSLRTTLDQRAHYDGKYPDLIVHLYFDAFITELLPATVATENLRCPFWGLWFKPPRPFRRTARELVKRISRFRRRYRLLSSPQCSSILVLDREGCRGLPSRHRPRIVEVPEFSCTTVPPSEPALVAELRRRAAGRRICSLVGSVEGRKGIRAFLRAAATAPKEEWYFAIAGKTAWRSLDQSSIDHLTQLRGDSDSAVFFADQYLDDGTLNAIVAASDLIHACYENWPYSSNMLCKSAAFGVPVIACDEGYLGRVTRDYALGLTIPNGDHLSAQFVPGFSHIIDQFSRSEEFLRGCQEFAAANQPDALLGVLRSEFDKFCGASRLTAVLADAPRGATG